MTLLSALYGGGVPRLEPDLTFPSSVFADQGIVVVTGIDASSALTTLLSLTGKYLIQALIITSITAENITVKLTVDGEIIWNDTYANPSTAIYLLSSLNTISNPGISFGSGIQCNSSFLLELQTAADNDVTFQYLVRPIK